VPVERYRGDGRVRGVRRGAVAGTLMVSAQGSSPLHAEWRVDSGGHGRMVFFNDRVVIDALIIMVKRWGGWAIPGHLSPHLLLCATNPSINHY